MTKRDETDRTSQLTESANLTEPPHASTQREVQRKLGRCLFRLQHYEIRLKALLSLRELSGPPGQIQSIVAQNFVDNAKKTLGQLRGEFMQDYLQPSLLPNGEIDRNVQGSAQHLDPTWFSFKFSVAISPEHHADIREQLNELVDLRNILAHHFVERFDVMTEDGCHSADLYLQDCYEKIDGHYLTLGKWMETLHAAYEHVASPEFRDHLKRTLLP
ncbi:hypothetical protein [Polaromonas sp. YR568]|uniref:hypothetical protein n=1 Tax=Polaromonas sp. YR568 TaxID=1855301 RepID=UPI0031380CE2